MNGNDFTADAINSPKAHGNIVIPRSISYQSHEYNKINITEGSLKDNIRIKSINFPENSLLLSIGKESFSLSRHESICVYASYLNNASISSANQHFKFLDEEHQIL